MVKGILTGLGIFVGVLFGFGACTVLLISGVESEQQDSVANTEAGEIEQPQQVNRGPLTVVPQNIEVFDNQSGKLIAIATFDVTNNSNESQSLMFNFSMPTLKLENTQGHVFNASGGNFEFSMQASEIIKSYGYERIGSIDSSDLMPGETKTYAEAFEVPAGTTADELTLQLN